MSYYNTTNLAGTELKKEELKALTQNTQILHVFRGDDTLARTPFDVQEILKDKYDLDYPITSIRRAITDLTNRDVLEKTDTMRLGTWNKLTHAWKLK